MPRAPSRVLIRAGRQGVSRRWARGAARKPSRRPVDIIAVQRESDAAVTLVLQPADGHALSFAAGQYLTLVADIDGQPVRRAYSISQPPHAGSLAVTVKAVPGGVFSRWALDVARPGMRLHAAGPAGDFRVPELADGGTHHVFAAAGSGITPVVSMIEALLHADAGARVTLHYGNRDEGGILFRDRLEALAERYPGFTLHHTLSQPGADWPGQRGRLQAQALIDSAGDERAHYYLCGPGDCIDVLSAALREAGVASSRIHHERFTAGVRAVQAHPSEPHPVAFLASQREIIVRPGESVLEAGLRSGLELPFSCTMGGCGHCKLQKRGGQVVMDAPNCLSEAEAAEGWFLACCSYPTERLEVQA